MRLVQEMTRQREPKPQYPSFSLFYSSLFLFPYSPHGESSNSGNPTLKRRGLVTSTSFSFSYSVNVNREPIGVINSIRFYPCTVFLKINLNFT